MPELEIGFDSRTLGFKDSLEQGEVIAIHSNWLLSNSNNDQWKVFCYITKYPIWLGYTYTLSYFIGYGDVPLPEQKSISNIEGKKLNNWVELIIDNYISKWKGHIYNTVNFDDRMMECLPLRSGCKTYEEAIEKILNEQCGVVPELSNRMFNIFEWALYTTNIIHSDEETNESEENNSKVNKQKQIKKRKQTKKM